ncbi:hypothetical protein MP638_004992 [Amoeboaphelidium occidentale]|nr:hypothetical protein MP638_004992 [Amoeboaphelidium occidentale]
MNKISIIALVLAYIAAVSATPIPNDSGKCPAPSPSPAPAPCPQPHNTYSAPPQHGYQPQGYGVPPQQYGSPQGFYGRSLYGQAPPQPYGMPGPIYGGGMPGPIYKRSDCGSCGSCANCAPLPYGYHPRLMKRQVEDEDEELEKRSITRAQVEQICNSPGCNGVCQNCVAAKQQYNYEHPNAPMF